MYEPKHYPESLRELRELDDLQGESKMTFDVKQNNWILPIDSDEKAPESFTNQLREHGMAIRINWEPAKIYNDLNRTFWSDYFGDWNYTQLREFCKLMGIKPVRSNKAGYIFAIAMHYKDLFQ